jgi:hypothetical protein
MVVVLGSQDQRIPHQYDPIGSRSRNVPTTEHKARRSAQSVGLCEFNLHRLAQRDLITMTQWFWPLHFSPSQNNRMPGFDHVLIRVPADHCVPT